MYNRILTNVYDRKKMQKVKIGAGFGFSWFSMFLVMASMFWGGAEVIKYFKVKP